MKVLDQDLATKAYIGKVALTVTRWTCKAVKTTSALPILTDKTLHGHREQSGRRGGEVGGTHSRKIGPTLSRNFTVPATSASGAATVNTPILVT